jgi:thiamine pyrophosphokinase
MNIQDLSILLAAIELAVKRGTFSIFEIGAVGTSADKLAAFLKDANAQAEAAKAEQAAAEGHAPAETVAEAPAEPEAPAA